MEDTIRRVIDDRLEYELDDSPPGQRAYHLYVRHPRDVRALEQAFSRKEKVVVVRVDVDTPKFHSNLNDTINGIPLAAIKDVLRQRIINNQHSARTLAYDLRLSERSAEKLLRKMIALGYLEKIEKNGSHDATVLGHSLALATVARRIDRNRAKKLTDELIERARAINADPQYLASIVELRLFGSMIEKTEGDVGDVDIAYSIEYRGVYDPDANVRRRNALGLKPSSSFRDVYSFGEIEVLQCLKNRNRDISLATLTEVLKLGCETEVIFKAESVFKRT